MKGGMNRKTAKFSQQKKTSVVFSLSLSHLDLDPPSKNLLSLSLFLSPSINRQDGPLRRLVHADPVRRLDHGGHQALPLARLALRRVPHVRPDARGEGRRRFSGNARRRRRAGDPRRVRVALGVHQRKGGHHRRHGRDAVRGELGLPRRQRRVPREGPEAPEQAPGRVQGQGRRRLDDGPRRPRPARAAGPRGREGARAARALGRPLEDVLLQLCAHRRQRLPLLRDEDR